VPSKVIIEAAAKDLIGIYTVDFDALVSDLLHNTRLDSAIVKAVDPEPLSRANKRERVNKYLATLEDFTQGVRANI
jgi:hypothetical protein